MIQNDVYVRPQTFFFTNGLRANEETEAAAVVLHETSTMIREFINKKKKLLFGGFCIVMLGCILCIVTQNLTPSILVFIGALVSIYSFSLKPEFKVNSLGKVYWSGYLVPFEDKSLLVDCSNLVTLQSLEFNNLKDPISIEEKYNTIQELQDEFKYYEKIFLDSKNIDGYVEYERLLIQHINELIRLTSENAIYKESVTLPLFASDTLLVNSSIKNMTPNKLKVPSNIIQSLDHAEVNKVMERVNAFQNRKEEGISFLKTVSDEVEKMVSPLIGKYKASLAWTENNLTPINYIFKTQSYNYYCPFCILDEVKSVMAYDIMSGTWYCPVCERKIKNEYATLKSPKIKDDLLNDVWNNLWIEKADQKENAIVDIGNQKRQYANEEYKMRQDTINQFKTTTKILESKIRDLQSDIHKDKSFVINLVGLMLKWDFINKERLGDYRSSAEQIENQVEGKYKKVRGHINAFEDVQLKKAKGESAIRSRVKASWNNYRRKHIQSGLKQIYKKLGQDHISNAITESEIYGYPIQDLEYIKNNLAHMKLILDEKVRYRELT